MVFWIALKKDNPGGAGLKMESDRFISITTDRLALRKLDLSDSQDFFEYRSLPDIYRF